MCVCVVLLVCPSLAMVLPSAISNRFREGLRIKERKILFETFAVIVFSF